MGWCDLVHDRTRVVFKEVDDMFLTPPGPFREFLKPGVRPERFDFTGRAALWYNYCYVGFL